MKKTSRIHTWLRPVALLVPSLCALVFSTQAGAAAVDYSNLRWTGTTSSDWTTASNWSTGAVPTAGQYIGFQSGSRTDINLINSGAGDLTFRFGGVASNANSGNYTMLVKGNSSGLAILHLDAGGFYSVNNSNNDRLVNLILDTDSKLIFTGSTVANATGRSTLWGANVTMKGNATADLSGSTINSVQFGSLNSEAGTTITTGTNNFNINGTSTIGGTITSSKTTGEAVRTTSNVDYTITDTGSIVLSGSSYVLVRYGNLFVNGKIDGDVRTQPSSNSFLGGSGTINGNVLIQAGTSLGGGKGKQASTLTINGDVKFDGAAALLSIYFFTSTSYDQIKINGNLDLTTGGALSVGAAGDAFVVKNNSFKLVEVTGDILGTFSGITSNFGVTSTISYRIVGKEVWMDMERLSFALVSGISPNQVEIGHILDTVGSAVPDNLVLALDAQITALAYGKVLNQLGPQAYQSWFPAAVVQASALGTSIEHRLAVPDEELRKVKKFDVYAQASRYESTKSTTENNEYYEFNPEQILAGLDYAISPSLLVGFVYAHDKTDFTLDDSGSTGDSKSNTYGLYGRYRTGALQASVLGYYGTDNYTADRSVRLTRLGTYATADTDGTRYGGRALVSYTLKPGWFDIAPTVGFQYLHWEADGFTEGGNAGEAAITVAKQSEKSFIGTAGFQFARSFSILSGKASIRPFLNTYWQFEACYGDRYIDATLMGQPLSIKTAKPDRNGWHIEGGFSVDYNNGLSIFASYGNDNNVTIDQTVAIRAGMGWRF